jgi:hypothetical protein
MIYASIVCAKSRPSYGLPCQQFDERLTPGQVEKWAEATLREHGWHVDEIGDCFCPMHNPADSGALVDVCSGVAYRPLGDSGWEARVPDATVPTQYRIEIRPTRATASAGSENHDG